MPEVSEITFNSVVNRIADRNFMYNLNTERGRQTLNAIISDGMNYRLSIIADLSSNNISIGTSRIRCRYIVSFRDRTSNRASRVKVYMYLYIDRLDKLHGFLTCNCNVYRSRYKICGHVAGLLAQSTGFQSTMQGWDAHNGSAFKFITVNHSSRIFQINNAIYELPTGDMFGNRIFENFNHVAGWNSYFDGFHFENNSQNQPVNSRVVRVSDSKPQTAQPQATKHFVLLSFITDKNNEKIHEIIQNFRSTNNLKIKRVRINNAI